MSMGDISDSADAGGHVILQTKCKGSQRRYVPVRAVWDDDSSKWWFCATDVVEALGKSRNPRSYWNAFKRRNSQLSTICRQLKLKAVDGKNYLTDVVDEAGLHTVLALLPGKKNSIFEKWLRNLETFDYSYYYEETDEIHT